MWRHSQKDNIDASNVTGDWDEMKCLQSPALRHPHISRSALATTEKAGSQAMAYTVGDRKQDYSGAHGGLFFGAGLPALSARPPPHGGPNQYTADGQLVEIEPPSTVAKIAAGIVLLSS